MSTKQNGFTLIEILIVILIIMILTGFMGWNYLQYHQRSAVEASARTLRSFFNDAKDNAKNGRFMSSPFTAGSTGGYDAACYVGDLTDPGRTNDPTLQTTIKALDCVSAEGYDGVGPKDAGGISFPSGGSYFSWLEMIASGGMVLDNWGVFFNPDDPGRIEMRALCKSRPRCTNHLMTGGSVYTMNTGGFYAYPQDPSTTISRLGALEVGVEVYKPVLDQTQGQSRKDWLGVEFTPLYLAVQAPLSNSRHVSFNNGGGSCYGERENEIVLGDVDGRYLYKFTVGDGGDVSEGCFCMGNLRSGGWSRKVSPADCNLNPGEAGAPCSECAGG